MNYARNVCGNAFMRKYCYNNHHIEVNLESHDDLLCGPHTATSRESMQFISVTLTLVIFVFLNILGRAGCDKGGWFIFCIVMVFLSCLGFLYIYRGLYV